MVLKFIDLFAGCGGLSLGLIKAGFSGHFAIEKNNDAFSTLYHNLQASKIRHGYKWPQWLPCQNMTTSDLLTHYTDELKNLSHKIDLIAGGPPCQGFSFVGLRNPHDPRNRLTEEYIKIVSLIKPKVLLLENVKGFQAAFKQKNAGIMKKPYSEYVTQKLEEQGYRVFKNILLASQFGVPQPRPRFVMIAVRNDIISKSSVWSLSNNDFYKKIIDFAYLFKKRNGLNSTYTPLKNAISDLEMYKNNLKPCVDSKGFMQIDYVQPKKMNPYLAFLRKDCDKNYEPNSLRIPNHTKKTISKFSYILSNAEKGHTLSKELREKFNIKKQCFTVLSPDMLSTTTTTSPDDCIHYSEPRVLTVRENARIQSFPDWFEFKGKYTTGGLLRREDCPRYSQVGNAVPPLMAEIIGQFLMNVLSGSEE
ncbi:MAG: DNA cytosine methyltransferase [Alphaproteobacteria bacterium]|nr:DNA cytosine methyltransferase [Alphaproteobacteria bacterium]